MSQIGIDENVLSETIAEQDDVGGLKLVPVSESIRYRKRAQSAEKKNEILSEQLSQAEAASREMADELGNVKLEQDLIRKLTAAGTVDLETAVLIAKARMGSSEKADLDIVVEQLKKEKQYLFGGQRNIVAAPQGTAVAKDRTRNSETILERAAKRAVSSGNRTDLLEYLKLRRNFV